MNDRLTDVRALVKRQRQQLARYLPKAGALWFAEETEEGTRWERFTPTPKRGDVALVQRGRAASRTPRVPSSASLGKNHFVSRVDMPSRCMSSFGR